MSGSLETPTARSERAGRAKFVLHGYFTAKSTRDRSCIPAGSWPCASGRGENCVAPKQAARAALSDIVYRSSANVAAALSSLRSFSVKSKMISNAIMMMVMRGRLRMVLSVNRPQCNQLQSLGMPLAAVGSCHDALGERIGTPPTIRKGERVTHHQRPLP